MKRNLIYIVVFFGMLIIIQFTYKAIMSLLNFEFSFYVLPWSLLILILIYFFVKKIQGINPWIFLASSFFLGMFVSFIGILFNNSIGIDRILKKNYIGVMGIEEYYDNQNDENNYLEYKTNIYKSEDRRIKQELEFLKNKYGGASKKFFYFWQTAFEKGYNPKYISEYQGDNSFKQKFILFFTVGPIYLLEILINIIMNTWILIIIPIFELFFKTKIFEKTLEPFIDFLYKK